MKKSLTIAAVIGLIIPVSVSAQFGGISNMIVIGSSLIDALVRIVGAIALLAFFWGLAKFLFKLGGEGQKAVDDGKTFMKWGLIAMFVMVSIWGLIRIVQRELIPGTDYSNPTVPQFNIR